MAAAPSNKKKKRRERAPDAGDRPGEGLGWRGMARGIARRSWISPAALALVWQIWLANILVFKNSGSAIERYTFASSHMEFKRAFEAMEKEAFEKHQGYDTPVAYAGTVGWPLTWLLRHYTRVSIESIAPQTQARYIILDSGVYEGYTYVGVVRKEVPRPPYLDRYTWNKVAFRYYWQPIPLDWNAMKKFWLLWGDPKKMKPDQQKQAEACRTTWGKLWTSMVKRDEKIQGRYRWEHLGGYDAYIGTNKSPDEEAPTRWSENLRPVKVNPP